MSGATAAMIGSNRLRVSFAIHSISDGVGNTFGYTNAAAGFSSGGSLGSATPSSIKGATIALASSFTNGKFRLILQGTLARTFIQGVTVQRTNDAITWLAQGAATFDTATYSGYSMWEWSSDPWTFQGTRLMLISY